VTDPLPPETLRVLEAELGRMRAMMSRYSAILAQAYAWTPRADADVVEA
jgi:hypothetical protein